MPEHDPQPEIEYEELRKSVDEGITRALELVRVRFEEPDDTRERLPFHNTGHTEDVIRRTEAILRVLREVSPDRVSERDIEIGRLAAAYHDTVHIRSTPDSHTGESEQASAKEAVDFMHQENERLGNAIFTDYDEQIVKEAIDGTVPAFDLELQTAIQPNVRETSSAVTRALAFADLGIAGMEGPEKFQQTGDALFREGNLDILQALESGGPIPDKVQEQFQRRMLGWSGSQSKFVVGRRSLFEQELTGFAPLEQAALRKLFHSFEETIAQATEMFERRRLMSFSELARDMGYTLR